MRMHMIPAGEFVRLGADGSRPGGFRRRARGLGVAVQGGGRQAVI